MATRITDLPLETITNSNNTVILVKNGKVRQTRIKDIGIEEIKTITSNRGKCWKFRI